MSELDLDKIEREIGSEYGPTNAQAKALIAAVRSLRDRVACQPSLGETRIRQFNIAREVARLRAAGHISCERSDASTYAEFEAGVAALDRLVEVFGETTTTTSDDPWTIQRRDASLEL